MHEYGGALDQQTDIYPHEIARKDMKSAGVELEVSGHPVLRGLDFVRNLVNWLLRVFRVALLV